MDTYVCGFFFIVFLEGLLCTVLLGVFFIVCLPIFSCCCCFVVVCLFVLDCDFLFFSRHIFVHAQSYILFSIN